MADIRDTKGTIITDTKGSPLQDTSGTIKVHESGSGSDALSIDISAASGSVLQDTKGSTLFDTKGDPLETTAGVRTIADSGSGSDSFVGATIAAAVADVGVGTDALVPLSLFSLADSGVGAEIIAYLSSSPVITDAAVGEDVVALQTEEQKVILDQGVGAELIAALSVSLSVSDSGSGADVVAQILNNIIIAETLSGTENLTAQVVTYVKTLVESGNAIEVIGNAVSITVADAGAAVDLVSQVMAQVPVTQTGVGVDTVVMATPMGRVTVTFKVTKPQVIFTVD